MAVVDCLIPPSLLCFIIVLFCLSFSFSTISWTNDTTIGLSQQFNRLMLVQAMQEIGNFINYDEEWWHFTLDNQPYQTLFDFPVC